MWPCLRKRHQPLSPALVSFSVLCRGNGSAASHSPPVNLYSPWGVFFCQVSTPPRLQSSLLASKTFAFDHKQHAKNQPTPSWPFGSFYSSSAPGPATLENWFYTKTFEFQTFQTADSLLSESVFSLIMKIVIEAEISSWLVLLNCFGQSSLFCLSIETMFRWHFNQRLILNQSAAIVHLLHSCPCLSNRTLLTKQSCNCGKRGIRPTRQSQESDCYSNHREGFSESDHGYTYSRNQRRELRDRKGTSS